MPRIPNPFKAESKDCNITAGRAHGAENWMWLRTENPYASATAHLSRSQAKRLHVWLSRALGLKHGEP